MKNYIQRGEIVSVAAPAGGVAGGDVVAIGRLLGVAVATAAETAPAEIQVEGVFDVAVASADVVAVGDTLYWDAVEREVTTASAGNTVAGYAVTDAGAGVTTVRIRLTPGAA
jgi:predicted RecA/RadA family phage recombinase